MKQIHIVIIILFSFCTRICAQDAIDKTVDIVQNVEEYFKENKSCPAGYKQIYIKCGNDLKPNCIVAENQAECYQCWEVHWGPCAGKTSGGMWFYNSFERANRVAYLTASSSSCPWFESSNYMIVLNDPKGCLSKPTGYEMVSWPSPLQLQPQLESIDKFPTLSIKDETGTKKELTSTNDLDGLLEELLVDNELNNDQKTTKEFEALKSQTKELLIQAEEEKKNQLNTTQSAVGLRGLAGKIESGEYDPYNSNKNTAASGQSNQNTKDSTNNSSGKGTNNSSGSSSTTNSGSSSTSNCKHNPGTGDLTIGSRNYSGGTCSLYSPTAGCSLNAVGLTGSGNDYIKIYNMPTASSGSFSIKDFLKCGDCDLYISYPYGASYSGTLTKTGANCFTLTCTMKDPGGKTSSLTASGTYK